MYVTRAAVIMIVGGYLGTVSIVTTVKWFWFVISMALFVVVMSLRKTRRCACES